MAITLATLVIIGLWFPLMTFLWAWKSLVEMLAPSGAIRTAFCNLQGKAQPLSRTGNALGKASASKRRVESRLADLTPPSSVPELAFFFDNELHVEKFWFKHLDIILVILYAAVQELLFPAYPAAATIIFVSCLALTIAAFAVYAPYRSPYRFQNYVRITICALGIFTACTSHQVRVRPHALSTSDLAAATALASLITLVIIFASFWLTLERGATKEKNDASAASGLSAVMAPSDLTRLRPKSSLLQIVARSRGSNGSIIEGDTPETAVDRHAKGALAREVIDGNDRARFTALRSRINGPGLPLKSNAGSGYFRTSTN
jgi:hypothetical protein